MPEDKIHLAQADTDEVAIGRGTYASRSMMIGGSALRAAADEVIERGRRFAAHFMEADAADIAFADGQFTIAGTDRSMPIGQVAQTDSSSLIETVLRISVFDPRKEIVERFTREIAPLVTSGPQGTTGYFEGRPAVREVFAYWPCLIDRNLVKPTVELMTV